MEDIDPIWAAEWGCVGVAAGGILCPWPDKVSNTTQQQQQRGSNNIYTPALP